MMDVDKREAIIIRFALKHLGHCVLAEEEILDEVLNDNDEVSMLEDEAAEMVGHLNAIIEGSR